MKFGIINSFRTFCFRLQQCISLGNIEVSSNVCIKRLNNLPDEIAILHIIFAEHEQHLQCSLSRFLLFRFTMLKNEDKTPTQHQKNGFYFCMISPLTNALHKTINFYLFTYGFHSFWFSEYKKTRSMIMYSNTFGLVV